MLTVLDQAYFEYVDDPDYADGIEEYFKAGRPVVVLRTFSKIYGLAGLRVGYGVGAGRARRRARQDAARFDLDDAGAGGRAREPRLAGRARAQAARERRGPRRARADPARSGLRAGRRRQSGTSCSSTWAKTRSRWFEALLREGVIVRPLAGFGAPSAIRVTVGTPDEHAFLAAALGRREDGHSGFLTDSAAELTGCPPAARASSARAPGFRLLFLATLGVESRDAGSRPSRSSSTSRTARTRARGSSALLIAEFLPAVAVGLLLGPLARPALTARR